MSHPSNEDPTRKHRTEGFPEQDQSQPGLTADTEPTPDHGEQSHVGRSYVSGAVIPVTGGKGL